MVKRLIFSIGLLILIQYTSVAQTEWLQGYIITPENDTILGYIESRETRNLLKECYFKESLDGQHKKYSPADILGYRFLGGRYFISRIVDDLNNGNPVFLEFLVKGEVSIYHYLDTGSRYFAQKDGILYELKINTRFIQKDDALNELRSNTSSNLRGGYVQEKKEYIGMLTYLLHDGDVRKQIERTDLRHESLIKLAVMYQANVCPDEDCIVFEKSDNPLMIKFGIIASISSNRIRFADFISSDYRNSFEAGIMLRIENLITWRENLFLETGLHVQHLTDYTLSISDKNKRKSEVIIYNNERIYLMAENRENPAFTTVVNINTTALKIPVLIKCRWPGKYLTPHAGLGLASLFVLSQSKDFYYPWFQKKYNQNIPTLLLGGKTSIGSTINLVNSVDMLLEINYEHLFSQEVDHMFRFKYNQLSLNLGVLF